MVRVYMIVNAICIAVPAAVWIASVQVEYPDRLALIWIAIFIGQSPYANFGLATLLAKSIGRLVWGASRCICQTVGRIQPFIMGSEPSQLV